MRIKPNKRQCNMQQSFDSQAPKKPTNVSINSDLLNKARQFDINLSATLEQALAQLVTVRERESWVEANRNAIAKYNDFVDNNGAFGDDAKVF